MALDLTLLTTKAECDEALADLGTELEAYQHRTDNLDYAGRQADRAQGDATARLAGVQAEIDSYAAMLQVPGLSATLRKQTESKLRRATDRKDNLNERGGTRTGSAAFLAAVDSAQLDAQVAVLNDATAQVAARKGQLPA